MKGVVIMKARDVELRPASDPRVYLQIDGEYVGRTPARLRVVPAALNLLVPPEFVVPVNG
jgi:diacylglycerol kinase family enzyme